MENVNTSQSAHTEYIEPAVVDYGTLQDLTAAGGSKFEDSPIGTPIGNVTASSTP